MYKFILVALVLFLLPSAQAMQTASIAQATSAEALIEDAAANLQQSDADEIATVLLSYVETEAVARFTLGNHAKRLSDAALSRYTRAF